MEVIADIAVYARIFCRVDYETVANIPLMTFEAMSPGCAISEGAKSILDSHEQRHNRDQINRKLYNQLERALEPCEWKHGIKRSYAAMENAEANFNIPLRQAAVQAVSAKTNLCDGGWSFSNDN